MSWQLCQAVFFSFDQSGNYGHLEKLNLDYEPIPNKGLAIAKSQKY